MPLLEGVAYFLVDTIVADRQSKLYKPVQICVIITKFAVLTLELISAGYLGVAIYKIRQYIKKEGNTEAINTVQLI